MATLSEYFGVPGGGARRNRALRTTGLLGVRGGPTRLAVRMALGASAGDVSRLVVGDVLGMVGAGLLFGAVTVVWSRPLAASLVQDLRLESVAPLALGGVAIVAVAMLASYVPVRRAARVDPMEALRHE